MKKIILFISLLFVLTSCDSRKPNHHSANHNKLHHQHYTRKENAYILHNGRVAMYDNNIWLYYMWMNNNNNYYPYSYNNHNYNFYDANQNGNQVKPGGTWVPAPDIEKSIAANPNSPPEAKEEQLELNLGDIQKSNVPVVEEEIEVEPNGEVATPTEQQTEFDFEQTNDESQNNGNNEAESSNESNSSNESSSSSNDSSSSSSSDSSSSSSSDSGSSGSSD